MFLLTLVFVCGVGVCGACDEEVANACAATYDEEGDDLYRQKLDTGMSWDTYFQHICRLADAYFDCVLPALTTACPETTMTKVRMNLESANTEQNNCGLVVTLPEVTREVEGFDWASHNMTQRAVAIKAMGSAVTVTLSVALSLY